MLSINQNLLYQIALIFDTLYIDVGEKVSENPDEHTPGPSSSQYFTFFKYKVLKDNHME